MAVVIHVKTVNRVYSAKTYMYIAINNTYEKV